MNKRPLDDRGEDIFAPPEQPLERPRREETEKTREELLDEIYVRLEEDYIAAVTSRDITSDYIPIGTFTLSAHGMQAEIDVRGTNTIKPIIDKIKEDYPAYYAGMIAKENWPNPIINLIENTHVAVVVGPATCSVMMPATDKVCSSSKSDIDMVHQIYTGFYKKNPDIPPNDFIESKLFTIARMNLRENLLNYTASEKDSTQPWLQKFFKDVKKGNIWKHIKIDPEDPNNNKLYQFHKNADEEEEYDCLYGLHLEDLAMKLKIRIIAFFPMKIFQQILVRVTN